MDIRRLDPAQLRPDNGLDAKRLLPWPALNAPFEGSWCVVPPGASSGAHDHHEYEIWVAMTGEAELRSEGRTEPFRAGDVVHFTPGTRHQVVNEGAEPFAMYAVWWDLEMTERFAARHHEDAS
ncbi:cupin domain-containing protein [Actinomadura rupiterrae]|uniref:cupin domain-containing protein n=1 Tax=Actinomadura rupiterrae TaxID=559627 RepID=UPI0020A48651|nr:cupin domain-containing protein [Actinomadura rupiterrae]MCP2341718.1 mannose-6-phosphate isomerase-like protein (cupin superfamily) [Actinomadura rupiterrae]